MGSHIQRVMVLSTQFVALLGCLSLAVDAIPAPLPEPVPEPFFGLGLLGRLLAAYSRGEKEEDFGNCKCNRRTFHTKEKDKDKGCPCDTYGAPVGYNAPTSYEPIDDYGAPLAPVATYGAPEPGYGAPVGGCDCLCKNRRTFHTKEKEKDKDCDCVCDSGYNAPVSDYGAPSYDYQAPSVGYGAPVESYGAPSSVCACDRTFGNHGGNKDKDKDKGCDCSGYPTYEYGAPSVSYNAPSYTAPSYNAPSYNPPCAFRRTFGLNTHNKDKENPCTAYYRL